MELELNSYSSYLLYLKQGYGYTEEDLSNLLGVSKEVIDFFIDRKQMKSFCLLKEILQKEGINPQRN